MNWLLRQAKQPSTWKGIFVLLGLLGYSLDPELQNQLIISVTALIAAIEIFRNESKHELPPIELQSPIHHRTDLLPDRPADYPVDRMHDSMPPGRGNESGFNG